MSAEENQLSTASSFSLVDAEVQAASATSKSGLLGATATSRLSEMVTSMAESGRVVSSVWLEPSLYLLHMTGKLLRSDPDAFNVTEFGNSFNISDVNKEADEQRSKVQYWVELANYAIIPIIAAIFWSFSKGTLPEAGTSADPNDFDHWQYGVFFNRKLEDTLCTQCSFETCGMFCLACFCPSVRWAGTVRRVGFMGFWMAWGIFFVFCRGTEFVDYTTASWCFAAALGAYFRQQMRQAYGMKEQGGCSWVYDCCLHCFCAPCAIVQEAKQAEEAFRVGLPVAIQPSWQKVPFPANKGECCP